MYHHPDALQLVCGAPALDRICGYQVRTWLHFSVLRVCSDTHYVVLQLRTFSAERHRARATVDSIEVGTARWRGVQDVGVGAIAWEVSFIAYRALLVICSFIACTRCVRQRC